MIIEPSTEAISGPSVYFDVMFYSFNNDEVAISFLILSLRIAVPIASKHGVKLGRPMSLFEAFFRSVDRNEG
jgi:hypothetical protein